MKKLKLLSCFILASLIAQAADFEVGLYSIDINRKINVPGAKVYITEKNRTYIELQSFLRQLGITNNSWIDDRYTIDSGNIYNQEKIIYLDKKIVRDKNKNKDVKYDDEIIIEKDEKLYAEIDFLINLLNIKSLEKDEEKLRILIETNFKLPIELANIRKFRQEEFKKNDEKNIEKITQEAKFFEPGNSRLIYDYNKELQANNSENKIVDAEYLGQVLYGDFETYYGIYPDVKNYQTRLIYRDVYKNHSIIFGDVSTQLPRVLNGTIGEIRGISFIKNYDTNIEYGNDFVTISGNAPLGKFVELYQNNKLISYVDVKNGRYNFENIPLIFNSDIFYVVIYNQDGSIKKEYLNRYYGEKPEKKGEFGFKAYVGESSYDRYDQFIGEVDYGITNRLTLKTGYYDMKYNAFYGTYNPQTLDAVKLGFLYASDYSSTPYSLEITTLKNSKDDIPDITYKYNQILTDYRLSFEGGKYSDNTIQRLNKKYEFSGELTKHRFLKDNITTGLKFYSTEYDRDKRRLDEFGIVTRVGLNQLTMEYGLYKDVVSGDTYHDAGVRSYHFRDLLVYAGVNHREIGNYNETRYKIEIMNRSNFETNGRYRAFYEKSDKYGDVFGMAFDIDYSNWFTARGEYSKSNGRSSLNLGYTIDKIINLSAPNVKVSSVENSGINGIVYIDSNNNGKYDEKIDKPLPRTEVRVGGRTSTTDKNGKYKIYDLPPNTPYEIKFSTQNPIYKGAVDSYKISPIQASTAKIDIPVYTRKIVTGTIKFQEEDLKNRYLTTLYLNAYNKKTMERVEVVIPENDGFFVINNLVAGDYVLRLESVNNPGVILGETEVEIQPETREMDLELNIGGNHDERENKLVVAFAVAYNNK